MDKVNKSNENGPMLYIKQPQFELSNIKMQHSFISNVKKTAEKIKRKKEKKEVLDLTEDQEQKELETVEEEEEVTSEVEEVNVVEKAEENQEEENDLQANTKVETSPEEGLKEVLNSTKANSKSFKGLSNEEKINYLLSWPSSMPKMKCMIETDKDTYNGVVMNYKDETVTLLIVPSRKRVYVKLEQIKSIQMLSF